VDRAKAGQCRSKDKWTSSSLISTCSVSCHLLDPLSVTHSVTRPAVIPSRFVDQLLMLRPQYRHQPNRCPYGRQGFVDIGKQFFGRRALLSERCPNKRASSRWRSVVAGCPRLSEEMTPRLPHPPQLSAEDVASAVDVAGSPNELNDKAWDPATVHVQTISQSPRVRLIHNFVTSEEASRLINIATPYYHRSSTARAGSDDYRTSESAMLPASEPVVNALRRRMAHFVGYPVAALEPLQEVRYTPGQFYKPHHDYYNACETWLDGNRHFTFLVYLNSVAGGGGQTRFPALNITVEPKANAALLFNNCLDNGEPDERTQHEGVAPLTGIKYAINGWMRSKHLGRYS